MKRKTILMTAALIVLAVVVTTFGQENENPAELRGQQARERWQNMSEQQRQEFRVQMRERFNTKRAERLKAVEAIEEQLAKLKEIMEGTGREDRPDFRKMSPEERAEFRQQWMKSREERQAAIKTIISQVAVLQGQQAPEEGEELVIVNTGELKEIQELAVKENATETAERIERISRGSMGFGRRPSRRGQGYAISQEQQKKVEQLEDANKAPEFTLKSFDGKTVSLSNYSGKIVVLEWFSYECPFVRYHYETVSTMVELADKYKDKNVVWFAVNSTSNTTPQANNEFAQKHKLSYPILDDTEGKVGRAYGAESTPHMFIIDTKGNIAYKGAIDNSPMGRVKEGVINYVDKALTELIDGKPVSVAESKPYGCSVKYAK